MSSLSESPRARRDFVPLMALIISLGALAVDAMLPASAQIALDLGATHENDAQLIISTMFLGFALGQMFYGPFSDVKGRRLAIFLGTGLFLIGCALSLCSTSFEVMLLGRLLQGAGASSGRIVSMALIRDQHEGADMARIMSLVMAVFILVPAVAPALGLFVMTLTHWRMIFGLLAAQAVTSVIWFALRQPETLPAERRHRFSFSRLWGDVREVCSYRATVGYTVTFGLIFGNFVGYLTSAPQLFSDLFGVTEKFPLYFAACSGAIGIASILNSKFVARLGMRRLSLGALTCVSTLALLFLGAARMYSGVPPLALFMSYLMATFFFVGILMGNLNSLAMQPVGHVAGTASALSGSFATFISLPIGVLIGQSYSGTVYPLALGFVLTGLSGLLVASLSGKTQASPVAT